MLFTQVASFAKFSSKASHAPNFAALAHHYYQPCFFFLLKCHSSQRKDVFMLLREAWLRPKQNYITLDMITRAVVAEKGFAAAGEVEATLSHDTAAVNRCT